MFTPRAAFLLTLLSLGACTGGDKGASDCADGVWPDVDGDGHMPTDALDGCVGAPAILVEYADDCDDNDETVYPGAEDIPGDNIDQDCDGADAVADAQDSDHDGSPDDEDCAPYDDDAFPGAVESCDGTDNDCDGAIDEADAVDATTWFADTDADGYGDPASSTVACDAPTGDVENNFDCDDSISSVYPGAEELADGLDNDCDGSVDEGTDATDDDGDGYSDDAGDCDDGSSAISPAATETPYDGLDQDCSGADLTDVDEDGDDAEVVGGDDPDDTDPTNTAGDDDEDGYTDADGDCDDASWRVYPGASEACDDLDNDCDGDIDDHCDGETLCYWDLDGDGDGDSDLPLHTSSDDDCEDATEAESGGDCDDDDPWVYPGATEVCDGQANDCDTLDTWTASDEYGHVSFLSDDGTLTDLTGVLSTTEGVVTEYTIPGDGDLNFCADPDDPKTWYVNLTATSIDLSIKGIYGLESVTLSAGGEGRALTATSCGTLDIEGLVLSGGAGVSKGGALYASSSGVSIIDSYIQGNMATMAGGGMYVIYSSLNMEGVEVTGNTSGNDGGGMYLYETSFNIQNSKLEDNTAGKNGGGLLLTYTSFGALSASVVGSNETGGHGGGIHAFSDVSLTVADGSTISDNSAEAGGGIWAQNGSIFLNGASLLARNSASTQGGGLFSEDANVEVSESASITNNEAKESGGGVYNYGGWLSLDGASISSNTAGQYGGGVYSISGSDDCSGDDATTRYGIYDNEADLGGGLYLNGSAATLDATGCDLGNAPDDVYASGAGTSVSLGDDVTTTCTGSLGCY